MTAERDPSRREFLRLGGASLAGLAFMGASCGDGEQSGREIKLTFTHGPDESGVFQKQIETFNRRHKGEIKVKYRKTSADTGEYFNLLATELRAGRADADIISGDVTWTAQFADPRLDDEAWISDLSGRFTESERSKFRQKPIDSATYEGKIYGVPWFTDAGMLYYRKDLLEKSGFSDPPKTWDELKEQAKKVKEDSGVEHGFVFQGAEYEGGVVNGMEFIWNAGGRVLDGEGKVVVHPEAVEGLGIERGMVESGVAPEAVSSYKEFEASTLFLGGEAVFMRNWPIAYGLAYDDRLSSIEKPKEQIGIAPLPVAKESDPSYSDSGLGGWNLMINANTKDQDAAWEFIDFMVARERQKERAIEGGYLPTLKGLYKDKEIRKEVPVIARGEEAIGNVRLRPTSPSYSEMALEMAARFHEMLLGNATSQKTAQTLQKKLGNIVG